MRVAEGRSARWVAVGTQWRSGCQLDWHRLPDSIFKVPLLRAVIGNFSRRILAWTVDDRIKPGSTCRILLAAAKDLVPGLKETDVFMDGGSENVNDEIDGLFDLKPLRRVLAQVDVSYSNSLIEAFWRSLKHQWLYLNPFGTLATVRRLVGWYVREHNEVLPHAAFDGQTPDEVYFGRGADVPGRLSDGRGKKPDRGDSKRTGRPCARAVPVTVPKNWRHRTSWRSQLRSGRPECSTT